MPGRNSGLSPADPTLALLHDGSIEAAAVAATAGQWSRLTTLSALATSAPGRSGDRVQVVGLTAVPGGNAAPITYGSSG